MFKSQLRRRGRARAVDSARNPCTKWKKNLFLRQSAAIISNLLASGDVTYRISGMYIEFVNVAAPGDTASIPTYDRDPASGVDYYNGLVDSATRDYLRVPMIAATVTTSDPVLYPDGNLITFFAQTQGSVGVQGKPFNQTANSLVVGAALVAIRLLADPTQDLILSRFYFDLSDQQPKLDTGQVGMEWEAELQ